MAVLSRINVYPIKSLDGTSVPHSALVSPGALEFDREFAICDQRGEWINAKRTERIHLLRAEYDIPLRDVTLWVEGERPPAKFNLDTQRRELSDWLGEFFEQPVIVQQNQFGGFPDDSESPGPTVVSTATLARIGEWFDLPIDEVRRRFRPNLEIEVDEPFWEDRIVTREPQAVRFTIGAVVLEGTNPCQRCPVPTRDSRTGEATRDFPRTFSLSRQRELPDWAPQERFDHFFRLAVNTRISPATWNQELHVGDRLTIIGVVP